MAYQYKTEQDYKKIIADLKGGIYQPLYVLQGEEPYYIDKISDYIEEHSLSEDDKEFGLHVLYGADTTAENISLMAREFPAFGLERQVIIVKEAQALKKIDEIGAYAQKCMPTTVLVICYKGKKLDGRSAAAKTIAKSGCVFNSEKVPDYALNAWVQDYLTSIQLTTDYGIPQILADYLGNDLQKIENEIAKLKQAVPGITKITKDVIEKNIGISKKYNVFELVEAFQDRDVPKIFSIIKYFSDNPKELNPTIMGNLYECFKNIFLLYYLDGKGLPDDEIAKELGLPPNRSFLVRMKYRPAKQKYSAMKLFNIIALLREYDLKMKGMNVGSTSAPELLRELAVKILA